jgi:type IV conjugative transfer system protein TraL
MKEPTYLPQTLDEPVRLVLLTLDEVVIFGAPLLVLGFVFNALILGFLLGASGVVLIKKFKGEQGHAYWLHCVYWYLPPLLTLRITPPSFQRDYIG